MDKAIWLVFGSHSSESDEMLMKDGGRDGDETPVSRFLLVPTVDEGDISKSSSRGGSKVPFGLDCTMMTGSGGGRDWLLDTGKPC